jgi:hypothetical protein
MTPDTGTGLLSLIRGIHNDKLHLLFSSVLPCLFVILVNKYCNLHVKPNKSLVVLPIDKKETSKRRK